MICDPQETGCLGRGFNLQLAAKVLETDSLTSYLELRARRFTARSSWQSRPNLLTSSNSLYLETLIKFPPCR